MRSISDCLVESAFFVLDVAPLFVAYLDDVAASLVRWAPLVDALARFESTLTEAVIVELETVRSTIHFKMDEPVRSEVFRFVADVDTVPLGVFDWPAVIVLFESLVSRC